MYMNLLEKDIMVYFGDHCSNSLVLLSIKAQEEAEAQIQEMFSFIKKEEETYSEKGLCGHVLLEVIASCQYEDIFCDTSIEIFFPVEVLQNYMNSRSVHIHT